MGLCPCFTSAIMAVPIWSRTGPMICQSQVSSRAVLPRYRCLQGSIGLHSMTSGLGRHGKGKCRRHQAPYKPLRLHFDGLHTIEMSKPDVRARLPSPQSFKMRPTHPAHPAPGECPPSSAPHIAPPTVTCQCTGARVACQRGSPHAPTGGAACFSCASCWAAAIIIIFSCIIITTACILFCFTARASRSASHFFFRSACFLCKKSCAASGDFSARERHSRRGAVETISSEKELPVQLAS